MSATAVLKIGRDPWVKRPREIQIYSIQRSHKDTRWSRIKHQRNSRKHGVDLISNVLPFGRLWYDRLNAVANAIGNVQFYSCSQDGVIRVYDDAGNVIDTHKCKGDFKEW